MQRSEDRRYIHNLGSAFDQSAWDHVDRPALLYPTGESITYGELNKLSNKIARILIELKVVKGSVVCMFNNKSVTSLATMLACLKVGAIYTNLDTSSPLAEGCKDDQSL